MTFLQARPELPLTQPAPTRTRSSRDTFRALGVLAGIAATNIVAHRAGLSPAVVIPASAAAIALLAQASGLTLRDLGLDRAHLGRGLRWAAYCTLAIAAGITIVLLMPGGPAVFADARFPDLSSAAYTALIVVPFATVLPEELLFRGVLDGALHRRLGPRAAYAVGALAFGGWHAITSLSLASGNHTVRGVVGDGAFGRIVCTAGVVAVTSVAGLGLSWLRRRTGSLLAPIGLHWALNGAGALAAGIAAGLT